jgi:hypothetical protein
VVTFLETVISEICTDFSPISSVCPGHLNLLNQSLGVEPHLGLMTRYLLNVIIVIIVVKRGLKA